MKTQALVVAGVLIVGATLFVFGFARTADAPAPKTDSVEPAPQGQTEVTRAELSLHSTADDCWVAYKAKVYDITAWLPIHPGTAEAIAPLCGTAEEFAKALSNQHGSGKDARLGREGILKGTLVQ